MKRLTYLLAFAFFVSFPACNNNDEEVMPNVEACFNCPESEDYLEGTDLIFTNCSENATSYEWDFGDGNISTEENPIYQYEKEGKYTVKLTAVNKSGVDESTINIIVISERTRLLCRTWMPTGAIEAPLEELKEKFGVETWEDYHALRGTYTYVTFLKSGKVKHDLVYCDAHSEPDPADSTKLIWTFDNYTPMSHTDVWRWSGSESVIDTHYRDFSSTYSKRTVESLTDSLIEFSPHYSNVKKWKSR